MSESWPTGPVYVTPPTLPPDPADDVEPAEEPIPLAVEVLNSCPDPDCIRCRVSRVGGAEICRQVGLDFDLLPPDQQAHYATVAAQVMAAMSGALIEWGAVVSTGDES